MWIGYPTANCESEGQKRERRWRWRDIGGTGEVTMVAGDDTDVDMSVLVLLQTVRSQAAFLGLHSGHRLHAPMNPCLQWMLVEDYTWTRKNIWKACVSGHVNGGDGGPGAVQCTMEGDGKDGGKGSGMVGQKHDNECEAREASAGGEAVETGGLAALSASAMGMASRGCIDVGVEEEQ
ncbi:hypothetical protein K439DRAFT_1552300 [Ramaria rubella]|nr:hypothetical protein K439DRAFT_1552300 [Ramaria rubella]